MLETVETIIAVFTMDGAEVFFHYITSALAAQHR